MMKNTISYARDGYMLILALMITSVAVIIATYIFTRGSAYIPYMNVMADREKAKQLALGGIQIGMSQLVDFKKDEKIAQPTQQKPGAQSPTDDAKQLLETLWPVLNRWQTFALSSEHDSIDGKLAIAISSEQGKINLNAVYNFQAKTFYKGTEKVIETLLQIVGKAMGESNLYEALEKYLKERGRKLNDVTELLTVPAFAVFKNAIFYEPETVKKEKEQKTSFYLTDLFTVYSGSSTNKVDVMEPWLLSNSMLGVLGIPQAQSGDIETRRKQIEPLMKTFNPTTIWIREWNTKLAPLYGRELNSLPKGIESLLNKQFEPMVFSVLSYGTVGAVTQRVFAIIERIKATNNPQMRYTVRIKKLYWL